MMKRNRARSGLESDPDSDSNVDDDLTKLDSTSDSDADSSLSLSNDDEEAQNKMKMFAAKLKKLKKKHMAAAKKYKQKFKEEWTIKYKWLKASKKGSHYVFCTACGTDLQAHKVDIDRHAKRQKHIRNLASVSKPIASIFEMARKANETAQLVKEAELKMSLFLIEHNIPFSVADHLTELVKTIGSQPQVAQKITFHRTKATSIVNNCIGKSSVQKFLEILKHKKFSLIVDESTDITDTKQLCIVVRFLDENNKVYRVVDICLGLIEVNDCTSKGLYGSIVNFFKTNEVPYQQNMIGFAADGANSMTGKHNSVATMLKNDIPNLFILKCTCHSLALCCSYATKELPIEPEEMLREIYCYLKYSSLRLHKFVTLQQLLDVPTHKLLRVANTRWLALLACIIRVLEQYTVLKMFFDAECRANPKSEDAAIILRKLNNPLNELYLKFLEFVLPVVVDRNKEFQSENSKIYELYAKMAGMFRSVCHLYMKPASLDTDISRIEFWKAENFLALDKIYLGPKVMAELQIARISEVQRKEFRTRCLNFLVELAKQIFARFPFNDEKIIALKYADFINPLSDAASVAPVCAYLKFGDLMTIDEEFRRYKCAFKDNTITDPLQHWMNVKTTLKGDGEPEYQNLVALVELLLSLPHSSAACERHFSVMNNNKTKSRNRLETSSLNGILRGKSLLHYMQSDCFNFPVCKEMINLHNINMYEHKN